MCKTTKVTPATTNSAKANSVIKRRVSFAKGDGHVKFIASFPRDVYYTKAEKRCMRKGARKAPILDKNYSPTLLRAFASCQSATNTATTTNEYASNSITPAVSDTSDDDDESTMSWELLTRHRGMERIVVSSLNDSIIRLKKKTIRTIVDLHATAVANRGIAPTEQIARVYARMARGSKQFAQLLAKVDAMAVEKITATDSWNKEGATTDVTSTRDSPVTVVDFAGEDLSSHNTKDCACR